jgi:hypothetical protein
MKSLILLFTFILTVNVAFSAKFEKIEKASDFESYSLGETFKKLEILQEYLGEYDYNYFAMYAMKITSKKESEKVEQSFKQMVYSLYSGDYSKPEGVSIIPADNDIDKHIGEEVEMMIDYFSEMADDPEMGVKLLENTFSDVVTFHQRKFKNLKYYTHGHGNTWGGANGMVIYNQRTMEVIFIESVYSE